MVNKRAARSTSKKRSNKTSSAKKIKISHKKVIKKKVAKKVTTKKSNSKKKQTTKKSPSKTKSKVKKTTKKISKTVSKTKHLHKRLHNHLKKRVLSKHNIKHPKKYHDKEFNPLIRIPSGISGFDDLCQGGFPKNSVSLLGGDAGSGKSLFAMQFLVQGIKEYNEPGVYISFEESKEVVFDRMKQYGWDLEKLEQEKKFVFLQYTPEQVEQVLESGGGIVSDVVLSIEAKRVVFDSLTAFAFLFETEFKQRSALLSLFTLIRKWGCTALLIAEEEPNLRNHRANIMEFESDADILIYNEIIGNKREHAIEIYKMRGTNHSHNIYPISVSTDGIQIGSRNINKL